MCLNGSFAMLRGPGMINAMRACHGGTIDALKRNIMSTKHHLFVPVVALMLMSVRPATQAQPGAILAGPASSTASFPAIDVLEVEYVGTGCPQGSAAVAVSASTSELLMLFKDHMARTSSGVQTDYKSCNLTVRLRIPAGYTIAVSGFEYRGFAYLPAGAEGLLHAEYFGAGSAGLYTYTTSFPSRFLGDWTKVDLVDEPVWSLCGGDIVAYANIGTAIRKSSASSSDEAEIALDSIGYALEWEDC